MKMKYKTKVRFNKGSMTTVIPSAISQVLEIEHGDKIDWTAEVVNNKLVVTVEKVEENE